MEYKGYEFEIRTQKTAWDTWTSEAHLKLNEHEGVTLAEFSGVEDDLTKQYKTEEEARKAAKDLAEGRINRSLQKHGKL
jgi:hypothetical protein